MRMLISIVCYNSLRQVEYSTFFQSRKGGWGYEGGVETMTTPPPKHAHARTHTLTNTHTDTHSVFHYLGKATGDTSHCSQTGIWVNNTWSKNLILEKRLNAHTHARSHARTDTCTQLETVRAHSPPPPQPPAPCPNIIDPNKFLDHRHLT